MLHEHDKDKLEDLMLIRFQQLGLQVPDTVMTYMPMEKENEYDPGLVTRYLSFQNPSLKLVYPVVHSAANNIVAVEAFADGFTRSSYGIAEPANGMEIDPKQIDMVLVPLLAFDLRGFRVGYGKGYYDAFLAGCRNDAIRVGFSFFEGIDTIEDIAEHDMPIDYCVLPGKTYSFKR